MPLSVGGEDIFRVHHCYAVSQKNAREMMEVIKNAQLTHPAGSTGAPHLEKRQKQPVKVKDWLSDCKKVLFPPHRSYSSPGSPSLLSIFNGFSLCFLLVVHPSLLVTNKEAYPLNMLTIYSAV